MRQTKPGVGARINLFDNTECMVYDFNLLFPECPLPDTYLNNAPVIIGAYTGADCREIIIDGDVVIHKMFSDLLYGIDRDLFHLDETEKELNEINGTPV